MFSNRLRWDAQPNPLAQLLAEKRRAGAEILDLTESNPTHAGFEYPGDEILAALADERALIYDPQPRGLLSAREAVSEYYAERGMSVDAPRILLTASTSEAYAYIFKLLGDPGDEILVPRPSYPLFEYLAAVESIAVRQYPLRYDGAWHIDFAELESMIGTRTRAIVVVNPNNPTGSFLKRGERTRLELLGLPILSDEVFSDFAFAPDADRVGSLTEDPGTLTFAMSGLSKIAGLPQMKLGWIALGGPGWNRALEGLEWIADTFLSVGTPVQAALPRLLNASKNLQGQIRHRIAANLSELRTKARGCSPARVLGIEGGWYAVLQVPRTSTEEEWALDLLRDSNTLIQPGFFYDFEAEAFLVLSLLTPEPVFREGLSRILGEVASRTLP